MLFGAILASTCKDWVVSEQGNVSHLKQLFLSLKMKKNEKEPHLAFRFAVMSSENTDQQNSQWLMWDWRAAGLKRPVEIVREKHLGGHARLGGVCHTQEDPASQEPSMDGWKKIRCQDPDTRLWKVCLVPLEQEAQGQSDKVRHWEKQWEKWCQGHCQQRCQGRPAPACKHLREAPDMSPSWVPSYPHSS